MGLMDALRRMFGGADQGLDVEELARRLGVEVAELHAARPAYREFSIPKRSGGTRRIAAPEPHLKALQRRVLQRLLARLRCHHAAKGFEKGESIATNAVRHVGKAIVVRMDLQDFFPSTSERRVRDYFRGIGWNREASGLLTRLCTYRGGLPQGAPTSPRLSNLVNTRLDARIQGLADKLSATYTRYADDITLSFDQDDPEAAGFAIHLVSYIARDEGYRLHKRRKLHVRRRHQQQIVTGLVVNDRAGLPRKTRRWLRAVEHRLATGGEATLTRDQLEGWRSLQSMIARQAGEDDR